MKYRAAAILLCAACGSNPSIPDARIAFDARGGGDDAPPDIDAPIPSPDGPVRSELALNRDRLLASYLDYLQANPSSTQSNGLSGASLTSICDLWTKLDPSSHGVFLTLTARMQGSRLGVDGTHMLDHVTKLYRLTGGQGATATDPGSCGGGEYNRMMMSMDTTLQASLVAANVHQGALEMGVYDIADIPLASPWRDSHDLGGPHAPFDLSDETNAGGPRGQVQYFQSPTTSMVAIQPLGRLDLETLIDPYALEMDQDYDCAHNSNPSCTYVLYGPLCAPETSAVGIDIYTAAYGDLEADYKPIGCP
jgi:hypothetical protein